MADLVLLDELLYILLGYNSFGGEVSLVGYQGYPHLLVGVGAQLVQPVFHVLEGNGVGEVEDE